MNPDAPDLSGMNWLAILLSTVAMLGLGMLWYSRWSPTGRVWRRSLDTQPSAGRPWGRLAIPIAVSVVGTFLLMFMINHDFWAYRDAYTNTASSGRADFAMSAKDILRAGFTRWIGYVAPVLVGSLAWARKPWALIGVHAGYSLASILVAALLMAKVG